MSLDYAVLGFLNYGPRTGYDLKRMFDSSVRHFWPAQQSQIYQTLSDLEKKGCATVELVPQVDRPSRKVYSITEEGKRKLRHWLTESQAERPVRAPFLIQLFFAGELQDREVLKMLEGKASEIRNLLAAYEGPVSQPTFAKDMPNREQFFWYLTLDFGIESARFSLRWIEGVIDRLRREEFKKGIDGALTKRSAE